jgi:hypothetical protein
MKLNVTLCVLLLTLIPSLFGQDHAPTAAQCQADERLWESDLHKASSTKDAISRFSFQSLQDRFSEMEDCIAVDEERGPYYASLAGIYGVGVAARLKHFIERHNLMAQFLSEDAAGKR